MNKGDLVEKIASDEVKSLVTELIVEPIRMDREISEKYVTSVFARLREVAITRSIAEIKSKLQRFNAIKSNNFQITIDSYEKFLETRNKLSYDLNNLRKKSDSSLLPIILIIIYLL